MEVFLKELQALSMTRMVRTFTKPESQSAMVQQMAYSQL